MVRFSLISAIVYLVGRAVAHNLPTSPFGILEWIGMGGILISLLYYGWQLFGWVRRKLLWKVRNKLIISFSFVGLIPVIILACIAWLSITLIFRQLSVVYLHNEFEQITRVLSENTSHVVLRYYQSERYGQLRLSDLVKQEQAAFHEVTPGLRKTVFSLLKRNAEKETTSYSLIATYPEDAPKLDNLMVPHWAREGFDGIVSDSDQIYFRSLLPVKHRGAEYVVFVDLPLDESVSEFIRDRTSIDFGLIDRSEFSAPAISEFFSEGKFFNIRWADILEPLNWENQVNALTLDYGIVLEVPLAALFQHYFTQGSGFGAAVLAIIGFFGLVFIVVEVSSVLIGVVIARTITRSIYNIGEGARNIESGNFDYRIPSSNRDQLDAMATTFNRMSESVVELMNEVSDKERLEKEIEIAREVQTHLFPRELPSHPRLDIAATCLPARRVSGDYYDFIPYRDQWLDVIIADISGKGISAALLMASLQSSIRSHVVYQADGSNGADPVATATEAINRQLYRHTSPDKFATLVMSRIDTKSLTLTYCNAGHNPPMIVSGGKMSRMTVGGMVAGLFDHPKYEESELQLNAGDLVVYYTDGVVEAEDPRGEQFEDERLEELLLENAFLTADDIRSLILSEVSSWSRGEEQKDDVTVVVLKVADEDA
jgi:sigma-B regulation protein RsbU (phosphoserine phosphatase)